MFLSLAPPQGMICCCWLLALLCCLPQAFIFTTREGYDKKIISFQMFKLSEWVWQQKVLLVMTGYDKKIISFQMWSEWVSLTTEGTSSHDSDPTIKSSMTSTMAVIIIIATLCLWLWPWSWSRPLPYKVPFSILWCTLGEFEICTTSYPRWLSAKQYTIGESS